jgi:transposase
MIFMPRQYPRELRERAVRLVIEHRGGYESEYAAIRSIAAKLGVATPETLRQWVRQAEVDAGQRPWVSSEESAEIRRLKRENAELRRANEILKAASAFFASWTGHFSAREVHRRAPGRVRRRADLPCAGPAWRADRTEHLLRGQVPAAVGAGGPR